MKSSIIVIDDEQVFLDSVKRGLMVSGFKNVHIEGDSRKAADLFDKGAVFDIALIDITMPDMDGIALLEVIKNKSPDTECIMVTAVNVVKTAMECLKKGAYYYLVKPVTRDDLVQTIHRTLERKRFKEAGKLRRSLGGVTIPE